MKIKLFLIINVVGLILLSCNTVAYRNNDKLSMPTDTVLQIHEVEIIDSVIYKMLDYIIDYSKYCHGIHRHLVTHFVIAPRYQIRYDDIKIYYDFRDFSVYSFTDASLLRLGMNNELYFLEYNRRYFFLKITDIKALDNYFSLTSKTGELYIRKEGWRGRITGGIIDSKEIKIRRKRITSLGKSYIIMSGEIEDNSVLIDYKVCMCHYGKLVRGGGGKRFFFTRKLIYDIFCPIRARRRM